MKIRLLFAWYDLWVGAYWDAKARRLYVLPVPCIGVVIQLPSRKPTDFGHGICRRCHNRYAEKDYNGHDDWVCGLCYDLLTAEFEEDYN